MSKIFIIGHKNSDTDSVLASLTYTELKNKLGLKAQAVLAKGGLNKETQFVLEKFDTKPPVSDFEIKKDNQVILVDHNEPSQIDERVNIGEIVEIIDHHKLGGLSLPLPILVRIEPVGCTSTLIAKIFEENNLEVPKEMANLLICGILSDTLNFNSPTTTEEDKKIAQELNRTADLDLDKLSQEMFKAKSDLTGVSPINILTADYKTFDMSGKKIGIGVFETVDPNPALSLKDKLLSEMTKLKDKEKLDYIFFGIVDILGQKTHLLVPEGEEIIKKAFKVEVEDQVAILDGVVSRKKQIVPPLENYFKAH